MDLTALPDEVKDLVRAQLEAGRFQTVDEVVVEALRLLQEREELFVSQRDELRSQIAEGVAAEERGEPARAGLALRRALGGRVGRGRPPARGAGALSRYGAAIATMSPAPRATAGQAASAPTPQ
jgi:antitoxin ParD1/3/4